MVHLPPWVVDNLPQSKFVCFTQRLTKVRLNSPKYMTLGQFKSWLRAEGRADDTSDYIQYLTMAPKSRKVAQLLRIEDNADLD